jgi:hypothetical protein
MRRAFRLGATAVNAGIESACEQFLYPVYSLSFAMSRPRWCEPEDLAKWNENAYCWVKMTAGYNEDEQPWAVLAPAIFDRLPFRHGDDPDSIMRRYPTENAAYRALWDACEAYASLPRPMAKT